MVDLSKNRRIFLRPGYTDMRLGVMGLSKLIGKPETGCAYTFCGAKGRMVKIIEYEGQSIWLHIKKAPLLAMTALMALSMFALFRTSSRRLMRLSFPPFRSDSNFPTLSIGMWLPTAIRTLTVVWFSPSPFGYYGLC